MAPQHNGFACAYPDVLRRQANTDNNQPLVPVLQHFCCDAELGILDE